jgi:hypothetical protein
VLVEEEAEEEGEKEVENEEVYEGVQVGGITVVEMSSTGTMTRCHHRRTLCPLTVLLI